MRSVNCFLFILLFSVCVKAQSRKIQFVHNSVDPIISSVNVFWNDSLIIQGFNYQTASSFIELPSWSGAAIDRIYFTEAQYTDTASSFYFWNLPQNDGVYQAVLNGALISFGTTQQQFIHIDVSSNVRIASSNANAAEIRFHHGVDDAPAIDIGESSTIIPTLWADNIGYGQFSTYTEITDSIYRVGLFDTESIILFRAYAAYFNQSQFIGNAYSLILSGLSGTDFIDTDLELSLYRVGPEGGPFVELPPVSVLDTARIQIIHAANDPALNSVDVYINNQKILDDFDVFEASPFINIPGNRNLWLSVNAGNSNDTTGSFLRSFLNFPVDRHIIVLSGHDTPQNFNPAKPLQWNIKSNAREQALDADDTDLIFFHAGTDLEPVNVRAFEPVLSLLESEISYAQFSPSGYISIPPFNYGLHLRSVQSGLDLCSTQLPFQDLNYAGKSVVAILGGYRNTQQNQNGEALNIWFADADGGPMVSGQIVTSIHDFSASGALSIFPNPSNGNFSISGLSEATETTDLEIFNFHGNLVWCGNAKQAYAGQASAIPPGMYTLRITTTEAVVCRTLVIIP
ncbi:MAG: T9SS type A sorting domain-containing protein [Bacteroidia bacterium]